MQTAVRVTATVQSGGKIEIADPQLPTGRPVDAYVHEERDAWDR